MITFSKPFCVSGDTRAKACRLEAFGGVVAWAEREKRPIFMGEFGACSKAEEASRLAWTRAVREQAAARGFSWAYWELASGFGVLGPRSLAWRQPLLRTLLPASK